MAIITMIEEQPQLRYYTNVQAGVWKNDDDYSLGHIELAGRLRRG